MPQPLLAESTDERSWRPLSEVLAAAHPQRALRPLTVSGRTVLEPAGALVAWAVGGEGRIRVPSRTLTQEGPLLRLPPGYRAVPYPEGTAELLADLRATLEHVDESVRELADDLLRRLEASETGEIISDLVRLAPSTGDLSERIGPPAIGAWQELLARAPHIGLAESGDEGLETVRAGDVIIGRAGVPIELDGSLRLWVLEDAAVDELPVVGPLRRLAALPDRSGGCAPGREAVRRLAIPWHISTDDPRGQRSNRVNTHAVNILAEDSRTHYHPDPSPSGGGAQWELYFVLDPEECGILSAGSAPSIITFSDLDDLGHWDRTLLKPGQCVLIPPNTGHRGLDVLTHVVAVPGFRPGDELYIDHVIAERAPASIHNEAYRDGPDLRRVVSG